MLKRTIAALALLVVLILPTAAPAFAWIDTPPVPCGEQYKIPFSPSRSAYTVTWDAKNRSAVTITVYFDKTKRVLDDAHAHIYHFIADPKNGHYDVRLLKHPDRIDIHHGCR